METIYTEKAPAAVGPYSQAVVINGLVYTSGQIAIDPATGELVGTTIEEQAEQVMKNLAAVLEAAGTGPENAVKTLCFLTDMNDFAAFNAVYARYFTEKPARSCVGCSLCQKARSVKWKSLLRYRGAYYEDDDIWQFQCFPGSHPDGGRP